MTTNQIPSPREIMVDSAGRVRTTWWRFFESLLSSAGGPDGLGTMALQNATAVAISGGTMNGVTIGAVTPKSAVFLNVTGTNLSGTNTGDQTIQLTGDVTGSGSGSFAATIGANKVANAKLAQMAANTIKGNNTGSLANATDFATSQIPGTATNDSASAGNVGELISSTVLSGSAVGLTNAVSANVTSISLTAGDWDVSGVVWFTGNAATLTLYIEAGISTTSATLPVAGDANRYDMPLNNTALFSNDANIAAPMSPWRLSLAATTTVYLVANMGFSVNTASAFGTIRARRMR